MNISIYIYIYIWYTIIYLKTIDYAKGYKATSANILMLKPRSFLCLGLQKILRPSLWLAPWLHWTIPQLSFEWSTWNADNQLTVAHIRGKRNGQGHLGLQKSFAFCHVLCQVTSKLGLLPQGVVSWNSLNVFRFSDFLGIEHYFLTNLKK